jgi:hypothetical protein
MPITVEKIDETTFNVTVASRTTTTHTVTAKCIGEEGHACYACARGLERFQNAAVGKTNVGPL